MGQKVNSLGLRLGINRTWGSKWYGSMKESYSRYLSEDFQIRKYLKSLFNKQNILVGYVYISRSGGKIFISLPVYALLGKDGGPIARKNPFWHSVTSHSMDVTLLEKSMTLWIKKPVHIKIEYASNYFKDSTLLAQYVSHQLEERVPVRSILKGCLEESHKDESLRGIRIHCSGRLDGAEMARSEWVKDGQVPLHTLHASIDYGTSEAHTIYGVCGVKAWICYHPKKEQYRTFPKNKIEVRNEKEIRV